MNFAVAAFDRETLSVTVSTCALVGVIGVVVWLARKRVPSRAARIFMAGLALLMPMLPVWAWLVAPTGYRVEPGALVVTAHARDQVYPLVGLESATVLDGVLASASRYRGNGGLFGWWGTFGSPALGTFTCAATTKSGEAVVLRWREQTLVLTPLDAQGLRLALVGERR